MAKNPDKTTTEEKEVKEVSKEFKAISKEFIKYGGEHLKPGDKFQVKESDVKELSNYAEIEIPEETTQPPVNPGEDEGDQESGGNGGQ